MVYYLLPLFPKSYTSVVDTQTVISTSHLTVGTPYAKNNYIECNSNVDQISTNQKTEQAFLQNAYDSLLKSLTATSTLHSLYLGTVRAVVNV